MKPNFLMVVLVVVCGVVLVVGPVAASNHLQISGYDAPGSAVTGEVITVEGTVSNSGVSDEQVTVEYRVAGEVIASADRTIPSNQSVSISLSPTVPSSLSEGTYTQGLYIQGTNASSTSQITVSSPGAAVFSLSNFQGPSQVNTGQQVTAEALVRNTGTASGSITLHYRIGEHQVASKDVTLGEGTEAGVTLQGTVPNIASGTYQHGIYLGDSNEGQTGTVLVGTPAAEFEVLSLHAPSTARKGDTISATATIRNTGDAEGSRTYQHRIGDEVVSAQNITLAAGSQKTVTFEGTVPDLAAGSYLQGVYERSTNKGLSAQLSITSQQASFTLRSIQAPGRAETGESVTVTVSVRNTGDERGSTTLDYRIDGTTVASDTVTLGPGRQRTVSLQGTVPQRSTGTYTQGVWVRGTANSLTTTLVIDSRPSAYFHVSNLRAPAEATVGDEITVTATVRNTGGGTARVPIEYRVGTRTVETRQVELRSNRSASLRFEVEVPDIRPGTYTQGVFVDDTNRGQTRTLRVRERRGFSVTSFRAPQTARVGDRVSAEAVVRNEGESSLTRTVSYLVGGRVIDEVTVRLDGGGRRTVSLEGTVPNLSPGTYSQAVQVDGEGQSTRIEVRPRPRPRANFAVTSLEAPGEVTVGGSVEVSAVVRNSGDASGTVTIEYRLDGERLASRSVSLNAGGQRTLSFTASVPDIQEGSYRHGVFLSGTTNGRDRAVTVRRGMPRFTVSDVRSPATATVGERITVHATVTNTGSSAGQASLQYRFDDRVRGTRNVSLDPGEERNVSFEATVPEKESGTYSHGVFVRDTDRGQTTSINVDASEPAGPELPGFTAVITLVALALVILIGRRNSRSR